MITSETCKLNQDAKLACVFSSPEPLSLVVYIIDSGGNKTLPPPQVSQPFGSIRYGVNTSPQGGSLPRRSQRPGQNSLRQWPCFHDQGEPYCYHGIRLWSA